jgi:hypothetical protein
MGHLQEAYCEGMGVASASGNSRETKDQAPQSKYHFDACLDSNPDAFVRDNEAAAQAEVGDPANHFYCAGHQ